MAWECVAQGIHDTHGRHALAAISQASPERGLEACHAVTQPAHKALLQETTAGVEAGSIQTNETQRALGNTIKRSVENQLACASAAAPVRQMLKWRLAAPRRKPTCMGTLLIFQAPLLLHYFTVIGLVEMHIKCRARQGRNPSM